MAVSKTSICNRALFNLGITRITSYDTDTSLVAALCRETFETDRDVLLQQFPWSFAGKRVELSPESSAPLFGFGNQFILPADFLAIREISENPEFMIEDGRILCDEATVKIAYTFKQTTDARFSPLFVELLALKVARSLAAPLKRDLKDIETINTLYELAEIDATDAHSKEDSRDAVDESNYLLDVR